MKLPSVLIFTVTYEGKDYCLEKFLKYSSQITYPNKRHIFIDNSKDEQYTEKLKSLGLEAYHVNRGGSTREALARSQNFARKLAIEENYDYIFCLESDVMVPPQIIEGLMSSAKPVISGLYFIGDRKKKERIPCIAVFNWNKELNMWGSRLLEPEEWGSYVQKGVKSVHTGSFGCCLIRRDVFTKIPFMFDPRLPGHSDTFFFNDCHRNKFGVFCDTDAICDHDNTPWSGISDR